MNQIPVPLDTSLYLRQASARRRQESWAKVGTEHVVAEPVCALTSQTVPMQGTTKNFTSGRLERPTHYPKLTTSSFADQPSRNPPVTAVVIKTRIKTVWMVTRAIIRGMSVSPRRSPLGRDFLGWSTLRGLVRLAARSAYSWTTRHSTAQWKEWRTVNAKPRGWSVASAWEVVTGWRYMRCQSMCTALMNQIHVPLDTSLYLREANARRRQETWAKVGTEHVVAEPVCALTSQTVPIRGITKNFTSGRLEPPTHYPKLTTSSFADQPARSSREGSPPHSLQRDGADHLREQWTATRMDSGELDPVPTPITARRNGGESTCNLPRTFPPYTSGIVWIVAATVSTVQRSRLEQRTTWMLPPRVL